MKKILSVLITLAILSSTLLTVSFPTFAAWETTITATTPATYSGSEGAGYLITSASEFMWLKDNPTVTAYLGADIAIGSSSDPFTAPFEFSGKFIGTNAEDLYTITAYITTAETFAGLFTKGTDITLKNIIIAGEIKSTQTSYKDPSVAGTGSLVGQLNLSATDGSKSCLIENCENYAAISGFGCVGGFVGAYGTTKQRYINLANLRNYGSVTVSAGGKYGGGIAGAMGEGKIANCSNFGNVYAPEHVGGILGYSILTTIYNSYNVGDVSALRYCGGILGTSNNARANDTEIINCYNAGYIHLPTAGANTAIAGIVGYVNENKYAALVNCYNVGTVFASNKANMAYPLVTPGSGNITYTNCYYLEGSAPYGETATGVASFTKEAGLKAESLNTSYTNGNIVNGYPLSTWEDGFDEYPKLASNNPENVVQNGTEAAPYLVYDKESFMRMKDNNTAYYKLVKSVSLGDYEPFEFRGSLVADELTEINVNIDKPESEYIGLFSVLRDAIAVKNIKVTGSVTGKGYVGGIAGRIVYNPVATESTGRITFCENHADINGSGNYIGGITGEISLENSSYEATLVQECDNYGDVFVDAEKNPSAMTIGGVVGHNPVNKNTISLCNNYGTISGNSITGGIAGYSGGRVSECANFGSVSGRHKVAGITAMQTGREVTICYNMGSIQGSGDSVGGIVGYLKNANITLSYNAGSVLSTNDTYPASGIAGQVYSNVNYSIYIQTSYTVGNVSNYTPNQPVSPVYGSVAVENGVANAEISVSDTAVLGATSGDYIKNLSEMKVYQPNTNWYRLGLTDYPFAIHHPSRLIPSNTEKIDVYNMNIVTGDHGTTYRASQSYILSNGDVYVPVVSDEGYVLDEITVSGAEYEVNEAGVIVISDATGDVTINVTFKEITVAEDADIQADVDNYAVGNYNYITVADNETINIGTEEEYTLKPFTNYAVIMSMFKEYSGYEVYEFGFVFGGNEYKASPYFNNEEYLDEEETQINENYGKYGCLFHGTQVKSGAELSFAPYIKLRKLIDDEEKTFVGTEQKVTIE